MLYTEVTYTIHNENELFKAGTIGLSHQKSLDNSGIKTFLRKCLNKEQKNFRIDINSKDSISEEVAMQRYGNKLVELFRKRRF